MSFGERRPTTPRFGGEGTRHRETCSQGMIDSASESDSQSRPAAILPPGPYVHIDFPVGGLVTSPATTVYGWLAVDGSGPLERLSLVNGRGRSIPLELHPRADVEQASPGKLAIGFNGWIDIRSAAEGPWRVRYELGGQVLEAQSTLVADAAAAQIFAITKARKMERLRALVRCPFCRATLEDDAASLRCASGHTFPVQQDFFDFLDDETRARVGAVATDNVSGHGYDATLLRLIAESSGPILDVGAGNRPTYREDVINVEIVPYPTTDVIGASEYLPFADDTFDLVISVAVLEHVRDPFAAARELQRVLRPGGRIFAAVPFLQPYHAYPDHYYNMTAGGLRNLFADLDVESLNVPLSGGPIYALTWILQAWRAALSAETAAAFDKLRVSDLAVDPMLLIDEPFVRELPELTNVHLAALNVLVGRKPEAAQKST
jgi:SAM-dependent methyltransferase